MRRLDLEQAATLLGGLSLAMLLCAEERARLLVPVLLAGLGASLCLAGLRVRSPGVWRALSVGALLWFGWQVLVMSGDWLFAAVDVLLYLLVNRLHNLRETRDYEQLLLTSFLVVLAVSILAVELFVLPFLAVYLVVSLATLELLSEKREREAVGDSTPARLAPRVVFGSALAIVGLAAILFFALPRVGAGMLQSGRMQPRHVSGFSPEVDLDDLGRIKENHNLVARVKPQTASGHALSLLRVVAYRGFDGQRWQRDETNLTMLEQGIDSPFTLGPRAADAAEDWFELSVEPLTSRYLPMPVQPSHLRTRVEGMLVDESGAVRLSRWSPVQGPRTTYEAAAILERPADSVLRRTSPDPGWAAEYVRLPPLDPRIRELGERLVPAGNDRLEIVRTLYDHLAASYRYSVDLSDAPDPLANFLFATKAGHCELFASALAILLRDRGVPARLVNGFRVTEWNGLGGYYLVRQSDAHAWVEVYFGGAGWVSFDPTPPDPEGRRWTFGLRRLAHVLDLLTFQWDRYVISLSGGDQLLALGRVIEVAAAVARWRPAAGVALLLALVFVSLLTIGWLHRRRVTKEPEAVQLYRDLRATIARYDGPLPAALGPADLVARYAEVAEVRDVVLAYIADRYAGHAVAPDQLRRARRSLRRLPPALRARAA